MPVEPCFAERTWTVYCGQHTANRREVADSVARAAQPKSNRKANGSSGALVQKNQYPPKPMFATGHVACPGEKLNCHICHQRKGNVIVCSTEVSRHAEVNI